MKNLLYTLLLFSSLAFAQSSGITYQAVIYNPAGEELPGVDNPYAPLTNQDVCLQFGIVDADGNLEYQEQVQVTTDPFGMVNLLIGTNTQTGGYAADFAGIQWTADAKFLVVDLDIKGTCNNFEELSNQVEDYNELYDVISKNNGKVSYDDMFFTKLYNFANIKSFN